MSKKLSLWLALVMAAFVVQVPAATPATAAGWQPAVGAAFNVPPPWGTKAQRLRIINKVEAAVHHAQPGSTVLVATYLFDKKSSVDALIGACRNGVSVRVILDGNIANTASERLVKALNSDNVDEDGPQTGACGQGAPEPGAEPTPLTEAEALESLDEVNEVRATWGADQSYVSKCDRACRGTGSSMHGKFYAFSRTGTASNIVMVSSSNLNRGGVNRGWNDLYTFPASLEHFQMYRRVHWEMTKDEPVGNGESYTIGNGPYLSRFFPWPGAGQDGDPVVDDLNKVRCKGSPLGRTKIHVAQFWIAGDRGNWIVDKLLELARKGCRVSIIYGAPSRQIADRLRTAAKKRLINLFDSRWDFDKDGAVDVRNHAKYILVKGYYGGAAKSWQVMTGTSNWSPGSLARGDENALNISRAVAWRQYVDNWHKIRKHSRRLPYNR